MRSSRRTRTLPRKVLSRTCASAAANRAKVTRNNRKRMMKTEMIPAGRRCAGQLQSNCAFCALKAGITKAASAYLQSSLHGSELPGPGRIAFPHSHAGKGREGRPRRRQYHCRSAGQSDRLCTMARRISISAVSNISPTSISTVPFPLLETFDTSGLARNRCAEIPGRAAESPASASGTAA